jgi:nitroreductase
MDTTVDLLNVRDAALRRRSIRAFAQQAIPREDLEAILDVVRLAPSAFNVQPWRFVVVQTDEVKVQLAAAAYNQRQVHSAPAVVVLYSDMEDALGTVDQVIHPGLDAVQRATTRQTILRSFEAQTPDQREAWGAAQAHIALGYLLLAAEAHGYQTSPMAGFDAEAVKRLLNLPANARVAALVALGRGAEEGFPHHRHSVQRIARTA